MLQLMASTPILSALAKNSIANAFLRGYRPEGSPHCF